MATVNDTLFDWDLYYEFADLQRLRLVLGAIDDRDLVNELRRRRSGFGGRGDWPVEAMLNAFYVMDVLQVRSTEEFRRHLQINPVLMRALGFPMHAHDVSHTTGPHTEGWRVPSSSAFSRFSQLLAQVESETGAIRATFEKMRDTVAGLLKDYGVHIGFDGKVILTHSTGHKNKQTGLESDPDAGWVVRGNKKPRYGYIFHLLADVTYELPMSYEVAPGNESEYDHCHALVKQHLGVRDEDDGQAEPGDDVERSELSKRASSFVADAGLDDDKLRRTLYVNGVTPYINARRMWQDEPIEGFDHPTRPLYESRVDTMVHDEHGRLLCVCPATGEKRDMHWHGLEPNRGRHGTLKYTCPADYYGYECAGRAACHRYGGVSPGARTRIVRIPIDADNLRNFPSVPKDSPKAKKAYAKRSAIERINARIGRDFCFDRHFIRGLDMMRMRVGLSMIVMLAVAVGCARQKHLEGMRSLVAPLAEAA